MDTRPEKIAGASQSIRAGGFFDLSGFKKHVDQIGFPQQAYTLNGTEQIVSINIPAGQDYLNDVQFWFKLYYKLANGNEVGGAGNNNSLNAIDGLHKLIRSISIKCDS